MPQSMSLFGWVGPESGGVSFHISPAPHPLPYAEAWGWVCRRIWDPGVHPSAAPPVPNSMSWILAAGMGTAMGQDPLDMACIHPSTLHPTPTVGALSTQGIGHATSARPSISPPTGSVSSAMHPPHQRRGLRLEVGHAPARQPTNGTDPSTLDCSSLPVLRPMWCPQGG